MLQCMDGLAGRYWFVRDIVSVDGWKRMVTLAKQRSHVSILRDSREKMATEGCCHLVCL